MWEKLHQLKLMDGILAAGMVLIVVGLGISLRENKTETKVEVVKGQAVAGLAVESYVKVDIEGEVEKPGVYGLKIGSRVEDLLVVSGGLSSKADREWVRNNLNKAEILNDGEKVLIPKVGENNDLVNDIKAATGKQSGGGVVRINSASLEELDMLPGVGPALGQRIIDYRKEKGGFKNVEEIKLVRGIGDKMWQQIKGKVGL